jgi:hypothetical protein
MVAIRRFGFSPLVTQRRFFTALIAVVLLSSHLPRMYGAELVEQAHSLRAVPADAAFYSASLRLKEQLDIFLESNAYRRLMEIPIIQLGKMQLTFQWQQAAMPQVATFKEYLESPEGQDTLALIKEMFAEEVFLYGSNDIVAVIELAMDLNSISRTARLEAAASGEDAEEATAKRVMQVLDEHAEKLKVPSVVMGWRISDAQRGERQLNAVHSLVRELLDEHASELSPHLQREQIAGHEFLTLRLDGSMIPWDELREQAEDVGDEQFDKWRTLMSDKTLVVALGIVDKFVLLSLGDSTKHLETFGQGESIATQPAIARLGRHADNRVASIGYVSKAFAASMSSPERTVEDLAGAAEEILTAAEVSDEQREGLLQEIRGLSQEIQKYMPVPGDTAMITFLTGRGYEGYQYRFSPQPMWDSTRPLTLLEHVGGDPALFVAARSSDDAEDYDQAIQWVKRIAVQVEKIAESKADPDDWARYQQYRDRGVELLERLDRANREHLIPAFQDGQSALVIDTSAQSKQWSNQIPESPKPLPMLELAIVSSVSDAEHLRQGVRAYVDVVRDTIELAREIDPDEVPEFELPEPERRELDAGGTVYVFPLPQEWGIDDQIALNAGLTDTVAVISCSPVTTERLLKEMPLTVDTSLDLKRQAAVVSHLHFADFVNAVRPWIDYGFDVATGKLKLESEEEDEEESDDEANAQQQAMVMQMGFVMPQIQQFLNFTTALRGFSTVTYEDDGVWVTHSETHIEDLDKDKDRAPRSR